MKRIKGSAVAVCGVSVDGVDCSIYEPAPLDTMRYFHEMNGAWLRYGIGVSILTGGTFWAHGPFPADYIQI